MSPSPPQSPYRIPCKPKLDLPKRPLSSPQSLRVNKRKKMSLANEINDEHLERVNLLSRKSSLSDVEDDDAPASSFFHKGPRKAHGYGYETDEDDYDYEDQDDGFQIYQSPPVASSSKYMDAIPSLDEEDNVFLADSKPSNDIKTRVKSRPKRQLKSVRSLDDDAEPDELVYSFRGARCAFPNPYKNIHPHFKHLSRLSPSHPDFTPSPNPKPKLLFADAHKKAQEEALEREENEARINTYGKSIDISNDQFCILEDYKLDDCTEVVGQPQSRKRSAVTQQPPVTPRPTKTQNMFHPSHDERLASARKSANAIPRQPFYQSMR